MLLYEDIRREYEHGAGTIRGVARKFDVHRRMVREAIKNAVPPERRTPQRASPSLKPVQDFIDEILLSDRNMRRKQRHTAHRIYRRIVEETPHKIAESTIRRYVRKRKEALGLLNRETFIPQTYGPGEEAQVDWYDAIAVLDGEVIELEFFTMRSMFGGGAFHKAYLRATQQAFLEAHEDGFLYFGGVFSRLRYDNLKSAVKKVLRGYQRQEAERFIAFRSHWGFTAEFCNTGRGNEKGGVECEVGHFRRNHLVPVLHAKTLEELNRKLLESCRRDETRIIDGRTQSVGALMTIERGRLLPLSEERFDLAERSLPIVDGKGCVKVRTNWYSTPLRSGTRAEVKLHADHVEIWHEGRKVAGHERSYGRGEQILNLEHYLDVLTRKPGALANARPLQQWREQGRWPACYDTLWAKLIQRDGRMEGTRQMIDLLHAGRDYGWENLKEAVERVLEAGLIDPAIIRQQTVAEQWERSQLGERMDVGELVRYERPQPDVCHYDELRPGAAL